MLKISPGYKLGWPRDQILSTSKGFLEDLITDEPSLYSGEPFNITVYNIFTFKIVPNIRCFYVLQFCNRQTIILFDNHCDVQKCSHSIEHFRFLEISYNEAYLQM